MPSTAKLLRGNKWTRRKWIGGTNNNHPVWGIIFGTKCPFFPQFTKRFSYVGSLFLEACFSEDLAHFLFQPAVPVWCSMMFHIFCSQPRRSKHTPFYSDLCQICCGMRTITSPSNLQISASSFQFHWFPFSTQNSEEIAKKTSCFLRLFWPK